jgi:hypothetical protein
MKDESLRAAIEIAISAFTARRDHDGDLIAKAFTAVMASVEALDQAAEIGTNDDQEE